MGQIRVEGHQVEACQMLETCVNVVKKSLTDELAVLKGRRKDCEYAYLSISDKDEDAHAIILHTQVSNSQSLCR